MIFTVCYLSWDVWELIHTRWERMKQSSEPVHLHDYVTFLRLKIHYFLLCAKAFVFYAKEYSKYSAFR